jgi:hypothetical protein
MYLLLYMYIVGYLETGQIDGGWNSSSEIKLHPNPPEQQKTWRPDHYECCH